MTTYQAITNGQIDQNSPLTQDLMTLIRDNPIAMLEGATDAPYNQAYWHPYDGVTVGDGNSGIYYNFADDGSVATVDTPTFENGYEYLILGVGVGQDSGAFPSLGCLFNINGIGYTSSGTVISSVGSTAGVDFRIELPGVRRNRKFHIGHAHATEGTAAWGTETVNGVTLTLAGNSSSVVDNVRLSWSAGSVDAGTLYLLRRKA